MVSVPVRPYKIYMGEAVDISASVRASARFVSSRHWRLQTANRNGLKLGCVATHSSQNCNPCRDHETPLLIAMGWTAPKFSSPNGLSICNIPCSSASLLEDWDTSISSWLYLCLLLPTDLSFIAGVWQDNAGVNLHLYLLLLVMMAWRISPAGEFI